MVKETIRMVTDALRDPAYGVNEFLSEDLRVRSFGDETRDDTVAQGIPLKPYPSLNVSLAQPVDLEGEVQTIFRDGLDMAIQISYMDRDSDLAEANARLWDTMRGVQRCLKRWLANENIPAREMDGVQVISCTRMTQSPPLVISEDAVVPAGILITLRVRDADT